MWGKQNQDHFIYSMGIASSYVDVGSHNQLKEHSQLPWKQKRNVQLMNHCAADI